MVRPAEVRQERGRGRGLILAWDGKSWRPTSTPTRYPLTDIRGDRDGLWASG